MKVLDNMNLAFICARSYLPERRRWRFIAEKSLEPKVFYGYDKVAKPSEHAVGGLVKLQDLNSKFLNSLHKPNILYLISSSLPHFPVRMAKMAKDAGVKLVLNQNGVAYKGWFGRGWEQANTSMIGLHKLADHIIYQSEFCKRSADIFLGSHCAGWEIAYNPVDTSVFLPLKEKKPKEKNRLLLAGSHGNIYRPKKAIETLAMLIKSKQNVELVIAGGFTWDSDQEKAKEEVMAIAKANGVAGNIRLTGPYTQDQAVTLMQNADLLVHTKYNDPCPRLVVEAMSCGLPILYSATGGVPELVGEDCGVGVPGPVDWEKDHPPSPDHLADGALKIINNLDRYSQAARKRAEDCFDVQPWLEKHEQIFRKLLS